MSQVIPFPNDDELTDDEQDAEYSRGHAAGEVYARQVKLELQARNAQETEHYDAGFYDGLMDAL